MRMVLLILTAALDRWGFALGVVCIFTLLEHYLPDYRERKKLLH